MARSSLLLAIFGGVLTLVFGQDLVHTEGKRHPVRSQLICRAQETGVSFFMDGVCVHMHKYKVEARPPGDWCVTTLLD